MGNRAVITTKGNKLGVYLHWNGGRDSVVPFITYCKMRGFRNPEFDCYGWARLCQVVSNFFGKDGLSIGIDEVERLDCDNWDNGVYYISDWKIVDREYAHGEQHGYDVFEMLCEIDKKQPIGQKVGKRKIRKLLEKYRTENGGVLDSVIA